MYKVHKSIYNKIPLFAKKFKDFMLIYLKSHKTLFFSLLLFLLNRFDNIWLVRKKVVNCAIICADMRSVVQIVYRKVSKFLSKNEPSRFTREEAISIARKYHLENEVKQAMKFGLNPDESLQEWDLYPYKN